MKRAATLLLTLLAFLTTVPGSQDSGCRPEHDRGNRCEGVTSVQTGNPYLEALSFTAGDKESFGERNVVLKVRFFQQEPERLSITARELDPKRLYFMRAYQTEWQPAGMWHEFTPWPTGDVLNRERISEKYLGVLVRGGGNHLLPALVYHSTLPASVTTYKMDLRTSENFDKVELTLYGNAARRQPDHKTWSGPPVKVNIAFEVQIDVSGFKEGPMRLVVKLLKLKGDKSVDEANSSPRRRPHSSRRRRDKSVDEANSYTEIYTFYHKPGTR